MENWFWLAILILALVVEVSTVNLVSIWFALGALVSQIVSWLGGGFPLQLALFVLVSGLSIGLLFPKLKKASKGKNEAVNFERIIGMDAVVIEKINPLQGTGAVKVDGKIWSARPEKQEQIPENTVVTILKIEGAHTVVSVKNGQLEEP